MKVWLHELLASSDNTPSFAKLVILLCFGWLSITAYAKVEAHETLLIILALLGFGGHAVDRVFDWLQAKVSASLTTVSNTTTTREIREGEWRDVERGIDPA